MSNCIEVLNSTLIPWAQLNQPQMLMARAAAASRVRQPAVTDTWAWFLTLDSVQLCDEGVEIFWGDARSQHTWRDFKHALFVLSEYLRPDVYLPFEITDEYDCFTEVIRVDADPRTMKFFEPQS